MLGLVWLNEVQKILYQFELGEQPVMIVASASIGLFVIRRVWKIIRASI